MTDVLVRKESFETESHKEKVAQKDRDRHCGSVRPSRKAGPPEAARGNGGA